VARLFARAGRVRYAWRPAATRTGVRESVAAARPPAQIDGAIGALVFERAKERMQNSERAKNAALPLNQTE